MRVRRWVLAQRYLGSYDIYIYIWVFHPFIIDLLFTQQDRPICRISIITIRNNKLIIIYAQLTVKFTVLKSISEYDANDCYYYLRIFLYTRLVGSKVGRHVQMSAILIFVFLCHNNTEIDYFNFGRKCPVYEQISSTLSSLNPTSVVLAICIPEEWVPKISFDICWRFLDALQFICHYTQQTNNFPERML